MAYVTLLSLIPSLAAIFALVSIFRPFLGENSDLIARIQSFILENLATGSGQQAVTYLNDFITNLDIAKIGFTGFAGTVVTLILLLRQIELAFNRIWYVRKVRPMFARISSFWLFLTLGSFSIGIAIGFAAEFNLSNLNPFSGDDIDRGLLSYLIPVFTTYICFTLLYLLVPNTTVPIRHAAIGAVPATILFRFALSFYGIFAMKFTHYQAAYGAMAAVPIFLLWLYVIWLITLFGAVVTWRAQEGFLFDDNLKSNSDDLSAMERLRNLRLQASLPLFVFVAVARRFQDGSGTGLTLSEAASSLGVSKSWIEEALASLEALNYIAKVEPPNESDQATYFLTKPPAKVALQELIQNLDHPLQEWLEKQNPLGTVELVALYKQFSFSYWAKEELTMDTMLT